MRITIVFMMLTALLGCDSQLQRARTCLSIDGRPVYAAEPPYQLTGCVFEGPTK